MIQSKPFLPSIARHRRRSDEEKNDLEGIGMTGGHGIGRRWGRLWSLLGALQSQDGSKRAFCNLLLPQERDEAGGPSRDHWIFLLSPIHSQVMKNELPTRKISCLHGLGDSKELGTWGTASCVWEEEYPRR